MSDVSASPNLDIMLGTLPGDEPWPIISGEGLDHLPLLDPTKRQLITWLTLPVAGEAFDQLVAGPLFDDLEKVSSGGIHLPDTTEIIFAERFENFRRQARMVRTGGLAVHGAFTPDLPDRMQWFIPSDNSDKHYVTATTTVSFTPPTKNGFQRMTLAAELLRGKSAHLRKVDQLVPRIEGWEARKAPDPAAHRPVLRYGDKRRVT